jgi:hypothetical protein
MKKEAHRSASGHGIQGLPAGSRQNIAHSRTQMKNNERQNLQGVEKQAISWHSEG